MQRISADAFRLLVENGPDAFFVHDGEGRLLDVNARCCADLGYAREELLALSIGDIARGYALADDGAWRDAPVRFADVWRRRDGTDFPVEISLACQVVEGDKLFLGLARDVSAHGGDGRVQEDALTGLAGRARLDAELVKACFHATRTGEPVAVAMIDIDHFGPFNRDQGAVRGDEALRAVAAILSAIARRPYDLAARLDGDRFVLLLPGIDNPEALLNRIGTELAARAIPHPGSPVAPSLTVSSGCVAASELADVAPAALLAECEAALRRAKANGRNRTESTRI